MEYTPIKYKCDCHNVIKGNCPNYRAEVEKIVEDSKNKRADHTPTPWTEDISEPLDKRIIGADGRTVCIVVEGDTPNKVYGNLNLIVRAVNSHDELVRSLAFAISVIKDIGIDKPSGTLSTEDKVKTLEQSLAKAEAI